MWVVSGWGVWKRRKERGKAKNPESPPSPSLSSTTHPHNAGQRSHIRHLLDGGQEATATAAPARDGVGELLKHEGRQ